MTGYLNINHSQEKQMENTQPATKAKIRPNISNMIKTPDGSFHKDDFIGNVLAGLTLAQVIHIARECGIDTTKYGHLNNGQIRMTLGGVLRKLTKLPEFGFDRTADQMDSDDKAAAVRAQITTLAGDFRDANKAADAARIAEKEAAIKAKADAKAAAKLEKVEKTPDIGESGDTDSEGGTLD